MGTVGLDAVGSALRYRCEVATGITVGEAKERGVLKRVLAQLRPADAATVGPGDDSAVLALGGDLVVTTRIAPDPLYTRDGADVRMKLPVTVSEAALGAEITVPAPNGKHLLLKVPAGTQPGKIFRFRGLGAPDARYIRGAVSAVRWTGALGRILLFVGAFVPMLLFHVFRSAYNFAENTYNNLVNWFGFHDDTLSALQSYTDDMRQKRQERGV